MACPFRYGYSYILSILSYPRITQNSQKPQTAHFQDLSRFPYPHSPHFLNPFSFETFRQAPAHSGKIWVPACPCQDSESDSELPFTAQSLPYSHLPLASIVT